MKNYKLYLILILTSILTLTFYNLIKAQEQDNAPYLEGASKEQPSTKKDSEVLDDAKQDLRQVIEAEQKRNMDLTDRYEKLLERSERQAEKYEVILSKWAKQQEAMDEIIAYWQSEMEEGEKEPESPESDMVE